MMVNREERVICFKLEIQILVPNTAYSTNDINCGIKIVSIFDPFLAAAILSSRQINSLGSTSEVRVLRS